MDGEEKTHSVDSGEECDVDKDKDSTGPGEKNDDLLIEEAYLYPTSSTYHEECSDSSRE